MLGLAVVCFYPVVGIPFDVVPRRRNELIEDSRIHRRRVSDHFGGSHLQHGHRPAEEPSCRGGVAAGGEEHVDDLPVLVDSAVHVPPETVDFDVGLVGEPPVAGCVPAEPGRVGE
ncbi:hypothetical protein GCM10027610_116020 [Dactylosporangium cerinum]